LAGLAPGEEKTSEPKEKKEEARSKLEEALAQALKLNPDIRVAAAKVSEAEAELNRVRLQVVQRVVQAYQAVEAAKATADFRQNEYKRIKQAGNAAASELAEREKYLAAAKAQLAAAQAEVAYLVGQSPAVTGRKAEANVRGAILADYDGDGNLEILFLNEAGRAVRFWDLAAGSLKVEPGPMADKIRKALQRPIRITVNAEPLTTIVKSVKDSAPELSLQMQNDDALQALQERKVTANWQDIPLGAVLQFVEDMLPAYRIVVRDYGLLLAHINTVPPGAQTLKDFLRGDNQKQAPGNTQGLRPPARAVEGTVAEVDEKDGLIKLSVGSAAGLTKGQKLEVYRLPTNGQPAMYLGRLSVIEVTTTSAVSRREGKVLRLGPIQPGDRVTNQLFNFND
jgi:hypothetical protein